MGMLSSEAPRVRILAAAAVCALATHIAFVCVLPAKWTARPSPDYKGYYEPVARRFAAGQGLSLVAGRPALVYPPGFSILYAGTFRFAAASGLSETLTLRVLEGILVISTAVLLAEVAMRAFGWRIALGGALLWSTYPFYLWQTKEPETASPFAVGILLALWLLLRWAEDGRRAAVIGSGIGVLLAASSLIRPIGFALPLVFCLVAGLLNIPCPRRSKVAFCLFLLAAHIAAVLPWEIWAWAKSGRWIPLSTNGPASVADGLALGAQCKQFHSPIALPQPVRALSVQAAHHIPELQTMQNIERFLLDRLKEGAAPVAGLVLVKAARSWYGNDAGRFEGWSAAVQAVYLSLIVWGAVLALRGDRRQTNFAKAVLVMAAYFWAMTVVALSIVRYMTPAICALMPLAAVAASRVWPLRVGNRKSRECTLVEAD
jgi:hypothetical protein